MGYYTQYHLTASIPGLTPVNIAPPPRVDEAMDDLARRNEDVRMVLDGKKTKWYDHERDLRTQSLAFPGVLFTLSGHGAEAGDEWTKYFLDGKMQRAERVVTTEPFNPNKLR